MATDYEVIMGIDGAVVVVLHPECQISKAAILSLLSEMGIDPSKVRFVDPADVDECGDINGNTVLIPLDDATCDAPELENASRQCATAGGRIVVLFGPGCGYQGLHPIAEKYGTQCDWSPDRLKGCVSGGDDAPRDSAGGPADRPAAHEVKCKK